MHDAQGLGQPRLLPPPVSQDPAAAGAGGERPTTLEVVGGAAGEGAMPVPPPRTKGHSRHASLDNQLIDFMEGKCPLCSWKDTLGHGGYPRSGVVQIQNLIRGKRFTCSQIVCEC